MSVAPASTDISPGMIRLFAVSAGLVVTLTQAGYALGLLFIVPLGDLLENRRLVFRALLATAAALLAAALSTSAWLFLAAALGIGLGSVAAQVLVPFAAHLSREETRGQALGKVVSGLLLGIMLARPVAILVLGQRAIFSLGAEVRSRLNGIYFALFFGDGALGSALGAWVFAQYGWNAALLYWLGELSGRGPVLEEAA